MKINIYQAMAVYDEYSGYQWFPVGDPVKQLEIQPEALPSIQHCLQRKRCVAVPFLEPEEIEQLLSEVLALNKEVTDRYEKARAYIAKQEAQKEAAKIKKEAEEQAIREKALKQGIDERIVNRLSAKELQKLLVD